MRRIIVTMWVSLDGFVADRNDDLSFVTGIYDQTMGQYETDLVAAGDTLMLGRVTYDSFAGAWPKVPDNPDASPAERDYARRVNAMKKVVFSKTRQSADWQGSTVYREIRPDEIQNLKAEPGKDILVYGSTSIVQQLTNLGLVDEYQILVHPAILGGGKPLFKDIQRRVDLKLVDCKTHPTGVVLLTYQPVR